MDYRQRLIELYAELSSGPKGPQWAKLAKRMNAEGLASPDGKPWVGNNVRQHYERMAGHPTTAPIPQSHRTNDLPQTAGIPHRAPHQEVGDTARQERGAMLRQRESQGLDEGLPTAEIPQCDPDDLRTPRQIINEQKAGSGIRTWNVPTRIPEIVSPKGPGTSLRLRPDFMAAAMEKAKEVFPGQRVTQTRLLNWLLMNFAEFDTDPELTAKGND